MDGKVALILSFLLFPAVAALLFSLGDALVELLKEGSHSPQMRCVDLTLIHV